MLTITEKTLELLRRIPEHPMLPSTAGLRIARAKGAVPVDRLHVVPEAGAHHGDIVLTFDGGRIFVGRQARDVVEGKMLDARTDERGRVQLCLTDAA